MYKKYQTILLTGALAAALLTGCGGGHTHETSGVWSADFDNHWMTCTDCGEKMDVGAHTLDDADTCTVCGAQLIDWGDSKSLFLFDENGEPLKTADYDADGNVLTETVYTYEYDGDGGLIRSTTTTDGVLTEEWLYTTASGESVPEQVISYMDDGSKTVSEYDEIGNPIRMCVYEADGSLSFEAESEYALSADGEWYETQYTETQDDGGKIVSTFAENGDQLSATHYEADGSVRYAYVWAYTYDEDGSWERVQCYRDGTLTSELVYATVTTEDGWMAYPETVTEYAEDGSRTVTVYDENETVLSETHYDASGTIISD